MFSLSHVDGGLGGFWIKEDHLIVLDDPEDLTISHIAVNASNSDRGLLGEEVSMQITTGAGATTHEMLKILSTLAGKSVILL